MTAQQTHHPGFNGQNSLDPFFGLNNSDENLVAVQSDYTPSHQSFYSPTPERNLKSTDGNSTRATSEAVQSTPPPDALQADNDWNGPYVFLTPNAHMSDNGYSASSDYATTPEQDLFQLGQDFGIVQDLNPQPALNGTLNEQPTISPADAVAPQTEQQTRQSTRTSTNHSTGTATISSSSHLMSPVLTDDQGMSSRDGTSSPPLFTSPVKLEPGHNLQLNTMNQIPAYDTSQQTPPKTESSQNTSPDMHNTSLPLPYTASPLIRVDHITRDDSPARQGQSHASTKRSRPGSISSRLSVQATAGADEEENEGDEDRHRQRALNDPVARAQVGDSVVSSLQDQTAASQREFKNADVADWLNKNAPISLPNPNIPPEQPKDAGLRRRAKSTGTQQLSKANLDSLQTTPVDAHIPGPGILLDVSSGEEASEDEDEIASLSDHSIPEAPETMNAIEGQARPGVYDELPNQPAWYRAKLWQDPLYNSADPGVKMQPGSSNDAMMRFKQRAADIETVSRVATWGTRRRSESDMVSLFSRVTLTSVKEDEGDAHDGKKRDRSSSILQRFVPKRNSTLRRKESDKKRQAETSRPPFGEHSRTSSISSRHDSLSVPKEMANSIKRMGSLKRPKSPKLDTGSAVAAMANPLAALGTSSQLNTEVTSPTNPFAAAKNALRRTRSRSDLNREDSKSSTSKLADLWVQQGGPPITSLAAPRTEEPAQIAGEDDEEEDDEEDDGPGVKMDLSIKSTPIIPTVNGFKENVKLLNPRLPAYMADRIAQEQLRRYKKLLDYKVKHVGAVKDGKCPSGRHCVQLGGEPTYFESKVKKEPEVAQAGFAVPGIGPSEEEMNALQDGSIIAAQFPTGVPIPQVKRLPAEFECSLCFKPKKFNKPSDWSKHVHEDVQPFTCTFEHCADPKSFKRKADWVRHENERHRQLEWWQCNINECSHRCFRKDNFVQHLVREHKLTEPKTKTAKAGKPAVRGPSAQKARNNKAAEDVVSYTDNDEQVWQLVDECKHETEKSPKDEPCKFCGNICNTWKKLTVHLAKHMEQISMPVLAVVEQRDVSPDTIISPIENSRITSQATSLSPMDAGEPQQIPYSAAHEQALPAGFTTMPPQTGYFADYQYQRHAPNTYPPPRPQQQLLDPAYIQNGTGDLNMGQEAPQYTQTPSDFDPMTNASNFGVQPSSSPEAMYGMPGPTSQPPAMAYQNATYGFVPSEQGHLATSPSEESMYHFASGAGPMNSQGPASSTYPPTSATYAPHPSQMQSAPTDQIFQHQQALPHQMNGQHVGYGSNQLPTYGNVSDEEMGGYGQPTAGHGYSYPQ